MVIKYKYQRDLRRKRIRSKISGTADIPRLSVFRSNKYIYAQLIDDVKGQTLVASCADKKNKTKKNVQSKEAGLELAKRATAKNIKKIVFDRNGYRYLGRVKSLAEGAREGGLVF